MIAIAAKDPPKKVSVSPINIFAGGALYHRKPKHAPTTDPQKMDNSPTSGILNLKILGKIVFPTTYEISVNESAIA